MSEQRKSGPRPNAATISVALLAGLATPLSPVHAQDRPLTADFPEVYRVGGLSAPDWAQFTERGDLGFDASGNLYVLDAEAFRVIVINPAGELVRTVGQRGEGPGDFQDPTALVVWRDGRFAVADGRQWAIQVFAADGSHDHFARMNTEQSALAALELRRLMKPHPDGMSLYAQGASDPNRVFAASLEPGGEPRGIDERGIERIDVRANIVAAEAVLQAWRAPRETPLEPYPSGESDGGDVLRVFLADMIMEPRFYWDVLPDGSLAYSDSSAYVVRFVAADGAPLGELRRPFVPEAVTGRMQADLVEAELDQFPRQTAMLREIMEEREFYPEVPIIRWLRATWEGGLWVRRRGEEPWANDGPIDVFGADRGYVGTYAGETRMPSAFGPDGLVAFWEVDEMDVPSIVVKRVPEGVR
ncbi:MAG: hypothetical protein OXF01_01745 [Gemmatimonadetes bacterium]|nr:hypothetical protein [Gemmatimonadota bacterium]